MSWINRTPRWLRILVVASVLAVLGAVVYLRYFYGADPPPPLSLSPAALVVTARRPKRRRSSSAAALGFAAMVALSAMAPSGPAAAATKATAKPKAGARCPRNGATAANGTVLLVCARKGSARVWKLRVVPTGASPTSSSGAAPVAVTAPAASPASTGIEGNWKSGPGSVAGYRVRELFVGGLAKVDAVGRSEGVTASVTIVRAGGNLVARNLQATVDMTRIASDESRRDSRMRTDGLETEKFPSATFSGGDVAIPADAEQGNAVKIVLTGKLTLHGVTRSVEIPAEARAKGGTREVVGSLAIKMPDWGIQPPEIADFVKADDDGVLEFKLVMKQG